jgi:hypothetical protein
MTIGYLQQKFMLALTVSTHGQSRIYFITPHTKQKAEMWKEYSDKLLNTEEPRVLKKGNKEISEAEVEELAIENVKKAIRNLKNNKVAGTRRIHPEVIRY